MAPMDADLIYDVGMHQGDDTAAYLEAGYRVVAIEADPTLVAAARDRFAEPLADGRLTLLDCAIGPENDRRPFWISSNSEYSSFSRQNASKWGTTCHPIEVRTRRFEDVLEEYGIPYYLKVDIEHADHYCLEALPSSDLPAFLSFEKDRLHDLLLARDLGYSRFKLIDQETFRQLIHPPEPLAAPKTLWQRLARRLGRLRRAVTGAPPPEADVDLPAAPLGDYAYGSSGPFGEKTDGPWRSMEAVALTWLSFDLGHTGATDPAYEDWFDVHCAR